MDGVQLCLKIQAKHEITEKNRAMKTAICSQSAAFLVLGFGILSAVSAESDPFAKREPPPIVGRWDLTLQGAEREYPSWLEVQQSGYRTLVGFYVGRTGSVRPISKVDFENGRFRFVIPPQWERQTNDITFEGRLEGESLRGETRDDKGRVVKWEGRRAPALRREGLPKWGEPVVLFNGRDLSGWKPRNPALTNGWIVRNGILVNLQPGNDLLTEREFTDFKLHAEFRYPKESNSGIYLRGRYEVQIEDNFGKEPDSHGIGGVYGFLAPRVNLAKRAEEWQTVDVTLVGRRITVELNGEPIIERQEIPGITGGALDSDEGKPGPILLQGDHGVVEFRNLKLTPGQ